MQSGAIKDHQLTASTNFNETYNARLDTMKGGAHTIGMDCSTSVGLTWFKIDFGQVKTVTGIATQGDAIEKWWITEYSLFYRNDSTSTINAGSFPGNKDQHGIVYNAFSSPITAKIIFLRPTACYENVGLRMELYGCP